MQNSRKKRVIGLRSRNVNDRRRQQFVFENIEQGLVCRRRKRIDRLVDENPARLVDQHARKSDGLLFRAGQIPVPPRDAIEPG